MSDETRGHGIKRRREALGIYTAREFERATNRVGMRVPRASIAKAEDGLSSEPIYARLEAALDRLEEETGHDEPVEDTITFRIAGNFGVDVTIEGPVSDLPAIEQSVARLIREMKSST